MRAATATALALLEIGCTNRGYCPAVSDLLEGPHQVDRGVCDGELLARVRRPVCPGHVVPALGTGRSLERVAAAGGPDGEQCLVAGGRAELAGVLPLVGAYCGTAASQRRLADKQFAGRSVSDTGRAEGLE